MHLEASSIRIICAKSYKDRFKMLQVMVENIADIFETHGRMAL